MSWILRTPSPGLRRAADHAHLTQQHAFVPVGKVYIWVKRYIMCAWPLHTAHMHAWACQCRYQDETTVHRQVHDAQNNHTTKVQCEIVCEYSASGM
jgi:hypothetical protein